MIIKTKEGDRELWDRVWSYRLIRGTSHLKDRYKIMESLG